MAFAALPAGGRALLSRVRVLSRVGTSRVMLGTTPVDLLVETRMEPFVRVRSDTWLTSDGRSTVMIPRTMQILENGRLSSTMTITDMAVEFAPA